MNIGFAVSSVGGAALGGLLIAELGYRDGVAGRRRLVPGDRGPDRVDARPPRRQGRARAVSERFSDGLRFARTNSFVRTAADRRGVRADPLHARHPDRGHLRKGEPRHDERWVRHPARVVGRRNRGRQPHLPRHQAAVDAPADSRVDGRDRGRLPRHGEGGHAAGRVSGLDRGWGWERDPVDLRGHGAPGAHARRLPGADRRACSSRSVRRCRASVICSEACSSRLVRRAPRTPSPVPGCSCSCSRASCCDRGSVSSRSGRMRAPTGTAQVTCHCRTPSLQRPPSRRARPLRAATIVRTA